MIIMIIFLFIIVVVVQKTVDNGRREKLQELREVKDGLEEIIDHLHNKAVPAVCLGFWDWRQFFPLIFPSVFLGTRSWEWEYWLDPAGSGSICARSRKIFIIRSPP